jgi:hypothetical protein
VTDPVRRHRAQVARGVGLGKRVGYTCFLLTLVLFGIGLATGFPEIIATTIVLLLVAGSLTLLPAIILGYAVRTAEREDRARGL